MIDEIREKIDLNKNDRKTYQDYIKSFISSEKAKEIFKDNADFKKLTKEEITEENENEDEFF